MANGCFGCKRQFGCKPYALAQEQAATHCEPLGWIPEQGYRLPDCPLEKQPISKDMKMATYKLELSKKIMRDYTVTVPDFVSPEDAKEWCEENAPDLWDVEEHDQSVTWDGVKDLEEGEEVSVSIKCDLDDDEYEVEGFYPWPK